MQLLLFVAFVAFLFILFLSFEDRGRFFEGLILFVVFAFVLLLFSFCFTAVFPGGDSDIKLVLGAAVFMAGEIAVCTYLIITKINKQNNL